MLKISTLQCERRSPTSQTFFAFTSAGLKFLQGGLSLINRRLQAQTLFKTFIYPSPYHLRVMSTSQSIPNAETSGATSAPTDTSSLTDIALSKPSFKWPHNRPFPSYIATSSRGSIPHLTPDNIQSHTAIPCVHVGLEDFVMSLAAKSPILSIQPRIQQFLGLPEHISVFFAARRANPLPINASWDDRVEINTIDGRTTLLIETFLRAVRQAKLREEDVVIGVPDITETPGVKRLMKMIQRTQNWLALLLEQNVPHEPILQE